MVTMFRLPNSVKNANKQVR